MMANYQSRAMVQQHIPKLTAPQGYRSQAIDVSIEADLLDFYLLRQRSVSERVAIAADLMRGARAFSLQCLSRQFAHLEPQQFARKLAEAWLQDECPPTYIPSGSKMTWIQNSAELATQLHTIFEEAGIPYYITGGIAAIAYGDPRTTRDVDMVIQMPRAAVTGLQATLEQAGFYVAGADDVTSGRIKTLQITQIETISRADLMIAENSAYARAQFERRRRYSFPVENEAEVWLASPEDIIISKLRWGLRSESEKQQRDVLAILKVQQGELDYQYIHRWAAEFDIAPLFETLTTAAGVRQIADQQWAGVIYPAAIQAFSEAQTAGRTRQLETGNESAEGNLYNLSQNHQAQTFTIEGTVDERLVAQFDSQGQALSSQPSLKDRQQWKKISERLQAQYQQAVQLTQDKEMGDIEEY
jgi:hypothetical protein